VHIRLKTKLDKDNNYLKLRVQAIKSCRKTKIVVTQLVKILPGRAGNFRVVPGAVPRCLFRRAICVALGYGIQAFQRARAYAGFSFGSFEGRT
jgi:hypothetical protein